MKEFDNIKISQITELLNENTTLEKFYFLIPIREMLINSLLDAGITDKYMFLDAAGDSVEELAEKTGIDIKPLKEFEKFLHLHDFINRKLSDIKSIKQECIKTLIENGIRYSKDYLLLCMEQNSADISDRFGIASADAERLFSLCDLMRLPGVKDIRSSLYYDCGYKSLQIFSVQNAADMQQQIRDYITKNNMNKMVPLFKELSTQIAAAKVLPHLNMSLDTFDITD